MEEKMAKELPFDCPLCPKKFEIISGLQYHLFQHTGEKPFQCRNCDYKTSHPWNLKTHERLCQKTQLMGSCYSKIAFNSSFHPFEKMFHDEAEVIRNKVIECTNIDKEGNSTKNNKGRHDMKVKQELCMLEDEIQLVGGKPVKLTNSWKRDISAVETTAKEFKEFEQNIVEGFVQKFEKESGTNAPFSNKESFKCHICPYESKSQPGLRYHLMNHTKEYKHQCPLCPFKCIQKSTLKSHLKRHSGEEDQKYKCNYCSYQASGKGVVIRHLELHRNEQQ